MPKKNRILLAHDDADIRAQLCAILEPDYTVLQVESGDQAVTVLEQQRNSLSLLLLGLDLPGMEDRGFGVLGYMERYHYELPVLAICLSGDDEAIDRADDLSIMDHIAAPFEARTIRRRVTNVIRLFSRQRRMRDIAMDQMYQREKSNKLMISILSHIVELRNGESGPHVMHIGAITELLLQALAKKTDRYRLSAADISRIVMASALHDIGKISIAEEILNKTEPLTGEEFQKIKTHTSVGAKMLESLPFQQDEPLIKTAHEICLWHHERWDGNGYPDGLVGDEIPIAAQVVSIADVYDALVSARSYKKPYTHDQALKMIHNGYSGKFNPLLLECLQECSEDLERILRSNSFLHMDRLELKNLSHEVTRHSELGSSSQILQQLEWEQFKSQFYASALPDITFSYQMDPPKLILPPPAAERLGLDPSEAINSEEAVLRLGRESTKHIMKMMMESTPEKPNFSVRGQFLLDGRDRLCQCSCQTLWSTEVPPAPVGIVGRITTLGDVGEGLDDAGETVYHEALLQCTQGRNDPDGTRLTGRQLYQLCEYLSSAFDSVRLVDASCHAAFTVEPDGALMRDKQPCNRFWHKDSACENCICQRAIAQRRRFTKFDIVNDELYLVVAQYLEVDGRPYALEMSSHMGEETLKDRNGKNVVEETISRHNNYQYTDPFTGVKNALYFDEKLRDLDDVDAVVLLNVDHYKRVNEEYGHRAGDTILLEVSQIVQSKVRQSDALLRYEGDNFMILFRSIPREALFKKLEFIRKEIEQYQTPGYPGLRLTVSIGGVYGPGKTMNMLSMAEDRLSEAKKKRNKTCLGNLEN